MARSYSIAALVALLAVLVWHQARFASIILFKQPLPPHYFAFGDAATKCTVLHDAANELGFCEDVIPWNKLDARGRPLRGARLLLSCDTNRLAWNTVMGPLRDPNPRGALWAYDYTDGAGFHKLELIDFPSDADFHPLGVSIFGDTLFVVNHGRHNSTIEVFQLGERAPFAAKHLRTLSHARFRSPNAVAATSATSFYLTQDHTFTRRLPSPFGHVVPPIETILGLPLGWVDHVSFTPDSIRIATSVSRVPFANGIAMDAAGARVAVAASSVGRLYLFARTASTGALAHATTLHLPFAPDNVHFDAAGRLLVAGHPTLPHLVARARNASGVPTPGSWVVSVAPRTSAQDAVDELLLTPLPVVRQPPRDYVVRTLYQSDGAGGWPTSTSAVLDEDNGVFFVSGLYAPGVLQCSTR